MTTIQPRNPLIGLVRLLALGWTLLSLLGVVLGSFALLYAGVYGCIGNASGWFGCTLATAMLPMLSAGSFILALVVLFFAHVFYVAGAKSEEYASRPRRSWKQRAGGFVFELVADILD